MEEKEVLRFWTDIAGNYTKVFFAPGEPFCFTTTPTLPIVAVMNLVPLDGPEARDQIELIRDSLHRKSTEEICLPQTPQTKHAPASGNGFLHRLGETLRSLFCPNSDTRDGSSQSRHMTLYRAYRIVVLHRKEQSHLIEPLLKDYRWLMPIVWELSDSPSEYFVETSRKPISVTLKEQSAASASQSRSNNASPDNGETRQSIHQCS